MKVLYLTVPSFFDLEISLIRELEKVCDVTVMLFVSPQSMHRSAFSISKLLPDPKIVCAADYEEMMKYKSLIDLNKWHIVNNPDNSFRSCYKLAKEIKRNIKKENYDIIHSPTDCKTSFFLIPTIIRFKNTLFTVHDPFPHQRFSKLRKFLSYDIMFLSYKNLLFLSDSLVSRFVEKYKGKYKKIYFSRLSVYDFLLSYPPNLNQYGNYILFFGRIDEYKGVDLLLAAYPQTSAYKQGIKLIVAGKISDGYTLDINVDNKIVSLNRYIPNEELANLINHSLFIVLPYRSATQSGCVFSSFAFNKPILATKVGDLALQVDEEVGHVILPNSVETIVSGIDYMIRSDLEEKSKNIMKRYSTSGDLGWAKVAKDLKNTYEKIIMNNK